MKIAGVASHERALQETLQADKEQAFCSVAVSRRAHERRLTVTRRARDYVQQCDRLIAKNHDLAEAS